MLTHRQSVNISDSGEAILEDRIGSLSDSREAKLTDSLGSLSCLP